MRPLAKTADVNRGRARLPIALLVSAWVAFSLLAHWGVASLIKGLGGGVLPARSILESGGLVAMLSLIVSFVAYVATTPGGAIRAVALATAAFVLKLGFLCAVLATPMRSEVYDYSLLDRHPGPTAAVLMIASALPLLGRGLAGPSQRQWPSPQSRN